MLEQILKEFSGLVIHWDTQWSNLEEVLKTQCLLLSTTVLLANRMLPPGSLSVFTVIPIVDSTSSHFN